MVKKLQKKPTSPASGTQHLAGAVKDSASSIWLAGLSAFSKAQEGGGKVFEAMVKEGLAIQRKTQAAAEEKITEATSRMSGMANDITSKATGQWDKLEGIFESRVAKALNKLGVPSAQDIDALVARIDELNKNVAKLGARGTSSAAKPAAKPVAKPAAKSAAKPAAKKAAKRAPARKAA